MLQMTEMRGRYVYYLDNELRLTARELSCGHELTFGHELPCGA